MRLVIGRGKARKVYEFPTGAMAKKFAENEPNEYNTILHNVCQLLGISR